jgi:polyvinyl alcohol dehydrogenase (cytochrome)
MRAGLLILPIFSSLASAAAHAQAPEAQALFDAHCAMCHVNPQDPETPTRQALALLSPDLIVQALTEGNMRIQGEPLSADERAAIAQFLTGRALAAAAAPAAGLCATSVPTAAPSPTGDWNGWGPDTRNTRFQRETGGIDAGNVERLKLKWAFGIPNVTQSRSQPAVVGGRLFMASQSGVVYALDAKSGCTYWTFKAAAGVRTAISVGPVGASRAPTRYAVYFADAEARAYAVDADTGVEIWSRKVDDHRAARATGAPTLYDGRLYVPVSGVSEESAAAMPDYECCTFRGSLTALDATTGEVVWKTYTVGEPRPRGKSSSGKQLWGPAGAPIWSAPTIDAKRGLIYAATGNAYADPAPRTSDAIVAFALDSGKIRWVNQILPDVWILGCDEQSTGNARAGDNPNCPRDVGPDFDFSASPALVTQTDGRELLVVTQKSGVGYALNPDRRGKVVWEYRWGKGSPVGGVWGATSDGVRAYFAVADQLTPAPGGLHAVDLATGQRIWYVPPSPPLCLRDRGPAPVAQQGAPRGGPPAPPGAPPGGCSAAQSAALTAIPGVVFSGSADGGVRAYASDTGKILWTYDTNRDFDTVDGVKANGGSIDGPGPVVADGMLYVTAGNAGFVGTPGNVLLAFGLD